MKEKFPNAGLSHDEKVEAGAAVFGETAATYAQEVVRLLEIQTSILNNIYQVAKTSETVLTSGRASSVAHSLRMLESANKKKKKVHPPDVLVGDSDPDDIRVAVSDKENVRPSTFNSSSIIPDSFDNVEMDDELATQLIEEEVDHPASQSPAQSMAHSSMPPLSQPSLSLRHSQLIHSSPSRPLQSLSSSSQLFPARKNPSTSSSMLMEAANIPEKLKKAVKSATPPKQTMPARKKRT